LTEESPFPRSLRCEVTSQVQDYRPGAGLPRPHHGKLPRTQHFRLGRFIATPRHLIHMATVMRGIT
jgi:hypothetical protein